MKSAHLFWAASPRIVKALVDGGANPNVKNQASAHSSQPMSILDLTTNFNSNPLSLSTPLSQNLETPLHICETPELATALVECGAEPHRDKDKV